MTDDFRMDYCNLWKSVVTMDEPQIMYYAGRLGAADAYELFATMLTSREWDKNNKVHLTPLCFTYAKQLGLYTRIDRRRTIATKTNYI